MLPGQPPTATPEGGLGTNSGFSVQTSPFGRCTEPVEVGFGGPRRVVTMNKDNQIPAPEQATGIDWSEVHRRIEKAREALERGEALSPEEARAILTKRARALAQEPGQAISVQNCLEIIEFRLSRETYGIEYAFVREVFPLEDLTPLPCAPSFVLGIVNVRGRIISVVDLKKFFNLPDGGLGDMNKIIIMSNDVMEFGILADVIIGTFSIPPGDIQPPPPTVTGIGAGYLKGVTGGRVIILDAERILGDEKIIVLQEAE